VRVKIRKDGIINDCSQMMVVRQGGLLRHKVDLSEKYVDEAGRIRNKRSDRRRRGLRMCCSSVRSLGCWIEAWRVDKGKSLRCGGGRKAAKAVPLGLSGRDFAGVVRVKEAASTANKWRDLMEVVINKESACGADDT
jgi:hypothetical protein